MTTSRQKANNKYNVKAYKQYTMRIKPELYQEIEELREELKLSKPELLKLLIQTYKEQLK